MPNHNFSITLLSDAILSKPSYDLDIYNGEAVISATALRANMRIVIKQLVETYGIEIEKNIFGFLSKDNALRSAFSITNAVAATAVKSHLRQNHSVPTSQLSQAEIISKGTCFSGILQVDAHEGSIEDIAIRTALLSVQSVGRQQCDGYGRCSVDFPEGNVGQDWIYRSGKTLESEAAKLE